MVQKNYLLALASKTDTTRASLLLPTCNKNQQLAGLKL
jgi:hypothetical protein